MPSASASSRNARKSSSVPSSGCDGVVAALGPADGPRAAGVVGRRRERVVAALAVGDADRVDRRQVHDVEAHLGDRRQPLGGAGEPALAAREQLVPRRRPGPARGRPTARRSCAAVRSCGIGDAGQQLGQVLVEPGVELRPHAARRLRSVAAVSSTRWRCSLAARAAPARRGARRRRGARPRGRRCRPRPGPRVWWRQVANRSVHALDDELVRTRRASARTSPSKRSLPACDHRRRAPRALPGAAPPHAGGDLVVAVAQDVGADTGTCSPIVPLGGVTGGRAGPDVADLDATHCWGDGRHGLGAYHPGPRGTPPCLALTGGGCPRIVGTDLPGRRAGPTTQAIHVGVQCKRDVEQLVAGRCRRPRPGT